MSAIQSVTIGIARDAAPASRAMSLYNFLGQEKISIGQLIMSVCCLRAAVIERQSVRKMNEIQGSASLARAMAAVTEQILSGTAKLNDAAKLDGTGYTPRASGYTLEAFLKNECGLTDEQLKKYVDNGTYKTISAIDDQTALFQLFKAKMDTANADAQEQTIDLQSLVSRRDIAFNTSASVVKRLMQTALNNASNY